jgi:anaerobic selenocysteine-containing dehydrogenase
MTAQTATPAWQSTACILCSINCGLEVQLEQGHIKKIRGDERHPVSQGYLCQKAGRLDHYQNHAARLTSPLRRRPDGSFEPVPWDVAIREVAAKLASVRDAHGGGAIAYYGGGGQGNHLGGVYASALRAALGTRYVYSALAQEKTGDFWVNGKLYGRQTCHVTEDVEHADFVLLIGTNPWQAHGIPRAREVVRELGRDPARTLVVVDPRRTETAELANVHLQLRPGTDAFLLAALLGTIVQEGLENRAFLEARTTGFEALRAQLLAVPVERYARAAGVEPEQVRAVARGLAAARNAVVRADLGLQQSLRSTLNSYLEKLLYLLTGHFGREGTNNFHTFLLPLIGHSDQGEGQLRTAVTGTPEISKLFPPNVLPAEIDSDQPGRLRALIVDSANPAVTGADTPAYRRAFEKLDLLVVVDVAMSETARMAHYVLPAASQFEKYEATFFNLEFPTNHFHLRAPLFEPLGQTLPEPEIYRRLVVALGALPERFPVLEAIARIDRRWPRLRLFPLALKAALARNPRWAPLAPLILHETLGAALPGGARAAGVLWAAALRYAERYPDAVRRAGIGDEGAGLGEALFRRILEGRSGTPLSTHRHEDVWGFLKHPDRRIHLEIPELLPSLAALADEVEHVEEGDAEYPFVLVAGERRAYNANTIYRDPRWRRSDPHGALRIHPEDAEKSGLQEGDEALCESRRGAVKVRVKVDDTVRPGLLTLPHGYGLEPPDAGTAAGPQVNLLTSADHCDPIAKTPFHKHVAVRLRPVVSA